MARRTLLRMSYRALALSFERWGESVDHLRVLNQVRTCGRWWEGLTEHGREGRREDLLWLGPADPLLCVCDAVWRGSFLWRERRRVRTGQRRERRQRRSSCRLVDRRLQQGETYGDTHNKSAGDNRC